MSVDVESKFPEGRRLVSVLFADILGFSTLADQLDPEIVSGLMRDLWSRLNKIVEEHGGFVDKQLGDSIMVIWGVPESLEDDAERAVSASLELLTGLNKFKENTEYSEAKTLQLRMGIHTGLALAGNVGIHGEYTVLGNTVRIAQRMEENAEQGSLIVSEATYQSIRGAFQVKRLTPVQLVGTKKLVNIFHFIHQQSMHADICGRCKIQIKAVPN